MDHAGERCGQEGISLVERADHDVDDPLARLGTIGQTGVFRDLRERYIYNLKEKVLDPLLENENFRRAIKEFNEDGFKTYDKKIREDVSYLIANLGKKYRYSEQGAKDVCIYVIDNDLAKKFANP